VCLSDMDMEHGKTKTRFITTIKTTATTEIIVLQVVTISTTTPQTSHDRGNDDSNPGNHNCVSCHSYHLRAVVLTMSKYVVATMIPLMGGTRTTKTKARHILTTTLATRATRITSIDKEENNKYSP
jgi:hypothetical protein